MVEAADLSPAKSGFESQWGYAVKSTFTIHILLKGEPMTFRIRDPYPTKHLLENMKVRGVTWAEIVDVLENSEVVFGPDTKGRYVFQKEDLSVVVSKEGAVITVLYRQSEKWTSGEMYDRKFGENR